MSLRSLALCFFSFGTVALVVQYPVRISAGPNQNARILLHLATPVSKNECFSGSDTPGCYDIDTSGQLDIDYFAYVILSNLSPTAGVGGLRFGITYDGAPSSGVDISSWNPCGPSFQAAYPGWPDAGTGIFMVWDTPECLPTVVDQFAMFVAGYFELNTHTADELRLTRHPGSDDVSIASCDATSDDVLDYGIVNPFGWAIFSNEGTASGSNPCGYDAGSCHITGPDSVGFGQTGIQYVMDPQEVTTYGSWSVYGNAQISSSNNSAAMVSATSPGTFWIRYVRSDCVEGCGCQRQVQVLGPTPVEQTTWGRIKASFGHH